MKIWLNWAVKQRKWRLRLGDPKNVKYVKNVTCFASFETSLKPQPCIVTEGHCGIEGDTAVIIEDLLRENKTDDAD